MMYELGITHLNGAAKSLSTPAPRVSVCVKMKAWRWVWVCNGVFCVHRCEYSDSVTMTTNGLVKVTAVCELKKKAFSTDIFTFRSVTQSCEYFSFLRRKFPFPFLFSNLPSFLYKFPNYTLNHAFPTIH